MANGLQVEAYGKSVYIVLAYILALRHAQKGGRRRQPTPDPNLVQIGSVRVA